MNRILIAIVIILSGFLFILYGMLQKDSSEDSAVRLSDSQVKDSPSAFAESKGQVVKSPEVKPDTYEWCIERGGEDLTPDFNAMKVCSFDGRIYSSNCISNENYFVIEKDTDWGGVDVVIKEKQLSEQEFLCEYVVDDNNYEIKGENPERVYALVGNHLLFSRGTGPSRTLVIYDLQQRKQVFTDSFSELKVISDTEITYWTDAEIEASPSNCSSYYENQDNYLGSAIQTKVSLDLVSLIIKELGETRCVSVQ